MKGERTVLERITTGNYKLYSQVPLAEVNQLSCAVYIIDYEWRYLFISDNAKNILGHVAEELVGADAKPIFKDPKFGALYDRLADKVNEKSPLDVTVYSPLRGGQTRIKGYPMDDCYIFWSVAMPAKADVMDELRNELKKRKS